MLSKEKFLIITIINKNIPFLNKGFILKLNQ